jgi:hypothetical protein
MKRYNIRFLVMILAMLLVVVAPLSSARSSSGSLPAQANATASVRTVQACTPEELPAVLHLAPDHVLLAGQPYLVKGQQSDIVQTFPQRTWEALFAKTQHGVAWVTPLADTLWPPEATAAATSPETPDLLDTRNAHNAWEVVSGWRTPFLMFSPLADPLDVVSLGEFSSGWQILLQVLDHENHFFSGQDRHAWAVLVRDDGSEQVLAQLEIADPARASILVPEAGEIQLRTHDSTIWWTQCLAPPTLQVTKTAVPEAIDEPGGEVRFVVDVANPNPFGLVLTSLLDDIYGDVSQASNPLLSGTSCHMPQDLAAGGHYSCAFTVQIWGNAYHTETNTLKARATDPFGREVTAWDQATVEILDVLPRLQVIHTADPTRIPEPGADVDFFVRVENLSIEPVLLFRLTNDVYGDITNAKTSPIDSTTCAVPQLMPVGGFYECSFRARLSGQPGHRQVDTVTAIAMDDEGNRAQAQDSAEVVIYDVPSAIEVTKTPTPTWIYAPEDYVVFRLRVVNTSPVDVVTIERLEDDIFGNLHGQGTCSLPRTLSLGASYACEFTALIAGEPETTHTNIVTASGTDDDGQPVSGQATAQVRILPPPSAVDLHSFSVSPQRGYLQVDWETSFEEDNWGFNLYRAPTGDLSQAQWVHFERASTSAAGSGRYSYTDFGLLPGRAYYYWLEAVDLKGEVTTYGPVTAFLPYRVQLPLVGK